VPKGGVARRATVIQQVRSSSANPVLLLDAGSALFGQTLANDSEGRVIIEAMNALGYDAMTVGAMDIMRGLPALQARAKEARFPLLSCNIVNPKDGKPVFAPYTVVQRGSTRFGILGVSEPDVAQAANAAGTVQVLSPVEAVLRYLPELRAKSDIVILLSHLGLTFDKSIAGNLPGIDVIVGGQSRDLLQAPEVAGNTLIVQAGYDGEWLGRLDVTITAQGPLNPLVNIVALGPEIADDSQLAALVNSYRQRYPTATMPAKQ